MLIPNAVLIKASEIPADRATESGAPAVAKAENALIIPITVPISPTRVPMGAKVAMIGKFFCNIGNSNAVDSSISF